MALIFFFLFLSLMFGHPHYSQLSISEPMVYFFNTLFLLQAGGTGFGFGVSFPAYRI